MIIIMLSVPILKETVPPRHWAAIAVGLCGLAVALCYALSNVVGRIISRAEPSAALVFWTTAAMALGGSVLSAPKWVDILPVHWPLLAALAALAGCRRDHHRQRHLPGPPRGAARDGGGAAISMGLRR
jgi:drug/metabolite transporter (DMT)-like permease